MMAACHNRIYGMQPVIFMSLWMHSREWTDIIAEIRNECRTEAIKLINYENKHRLLHSNHIDLNAAFILPFSATEPSFLNQQNSSVHKANRLENVGHFADLGSSTSLR